MTKARTAGYQTWQHGRRNKLVNSDFRQAQAHGTLWSAYTLSTGGAEYLWDQWRWASVATGAVFTANSSGSTPPDGAATGGISAQISCATADATVAAGEYSMFYQAIEGYSAEDLNLGINTATNMTLSFWAMSNVTGTFCAAFQNSASNRSYVAEYTIDVADTWEYKTITVPTDNSGTWAQYGSAAMYVRFSLGTGTTFQGAADTWLATNTFATANQVNLGSSTSNYLRLANVQLEAGDYATDYEKLSYTNSLRECQRYYFKTYNLGSAPGATTLSGGVAVKTTAAGNFRMTVPFPTTMRATPTVTTYSYTSGASGKWSTGSTDYNTAAIATGANGVILGDATNPGTVHNVYVQLTADARI